MPQQVDLTTCDREPIHIPGSIQPHGCLLACDVTGDRILRASDNAREILPFLGRDPIGASLNDCFPARAAHDLRNALAHSNEPRRPAALLNYNLAPGGEAFDIAAHRYDGHALLEFERAGPDATSPLNLTRTLIARMRALETIEKLARQTPRLLQAMLDYDRVMMYRFADDGSGKVIGESKRPHLESFMGQHFPAADIPQQARALYVKNTIRVIVDASGARSLIAPELDASGAPLDLSYAHLRSVSPIHLEYLRNMGVAASMSVSILVDGKLWGLIACHHYSPRRLTMPQRIAAEMFGDFLSLHLTATHHQNRYAASLRARRSFDAMMSELSFHESVETYLREHLADFHNLVECDGVGLWMNGVWTAEGSTPPPSAIPTLAKFARTEIPSGLWATHALAERIPGAEDYADAAAGALAVPLSRLPRDALFFFRKEQVRTLDWAGDPNKSYQTGPLGDRLTPRTSFAIWKQQVDRQSLPWSEEDHYTAEAARIGLQEVILRQSEVMEAERKEAEVRQRILNEELNHRVKNILALIKSLVSHKSDSQPTLEQYVDSLKGRIMALSFAHDQVVRSDGGGSLQQLLLAELSPYPPAQIELVGEDVGLDARAYSVMALVVHELATNAAKYGALSSPSGRLEVSWSAGASGCEIVWRERGGPPVAPPTRNGFGSVLLHRSVPFDLGGEAVVEYPSAGVQARFILPATHLVKAIPRPSRRHERSPAQVRSAGRVQGRRVLLVEDQLVIALDAEEMLRALGAAEIETAATAADALKHVLSAPPDVAVLDVNLGAGTSVSVAEELQRRAIPFVFATGYGDTAFIPRGMRDIPVVRKPFALETLTEALARVLPPEAS